MKNIRILTAIILIILMASMVAFGAPAYVNVGPTTEFDGDIKILSEIVAEGTTPDNWETTVFFTDPTADRTITVPDFDVTLGTATLLTVTDNEAVNENNAILFTSGGVEAGDLNIESDGGDFHYNPSTGVVTATSYSGDGSALTGVGAAAASALTITAKEENTGALVKGQPVYDSGAAGVAQPLVGLGDCDVEAKAHIVGLAAEAIAQNNSGMVRVGGLLIGVDTLGANPVNPAGEAWAAGDELYLSATTGGLTNVRPVSGHIVEVGWSLYGSSNTDAILVAIDTPSHGIHVAAANDIVIRMGDAIGANKVYFKDFANAEVAFIDSNGAADFNSLTLDTALALAEGGTGVATGAMVNFTSILNVGLYVGRDADNRLNWTTDDNLEIWIGGVEHDIVDIETGVGDNDSLVTQGYVDDAVVGGGATAELDNLGVVAINTSLISDAADTDSLGSATKEWLNLYMGEAGKIYLRLDQSTNLQATGAGILTITAANGVVLSAGLTVAGTLAMAANDITTTGYIGRDADNFIDWSIDDSLTIEIGGVQHDIVSISDGAGDNDKLCTQGYADDAAAGGGANVALSNLAGVAINLSLVSDAADTDDLGSATFEWLNLYLGTYGTVYFGAGQTESIAESAVNALTITASDGVTFAGEIITTEVQGIGRDADNYIGWGVDNSLAIEIGGVAKAIVSITAGVGDNDKLVTQGYVDDIVGGASLALDNLAAVQINTTLVSDAIDTDDLGTAAAEWRSLYIGTAGKIYLGLDQEVSLEVTDANTLYITASANVSLSGGLIVAGVLDLDGRVTGGALGTEIAVGANVYGVAWYYFGDNADVTGLRSRAVLKTTDAPAKTATGAIIQASNDDDINVLALNGALIEAIGKSTANASTITHMRGAIIGSEWNAFDTVTNLKTLYVRTHTRNSAGAGSVSGTGYLLYLENEAVGGVGQQLDAGIYLKATNVSTPKAFDFGIDLSGAVGEIATADIKLSYGETIKNTTDGIIEFGGEIDFGAHSAGFTLQTLTGDGTDDIDWRLGNKFQFTHHAGDETFTFTAPTNPGSFILEIIQDGVGGRDITWPANVKWLGTEPTWAGGGAAKTIVVAFWYNGTNYFGQGTPWES